MEAHDPPRERGHALLVSDHRDSDPALGVELAENAEKTFYDTENSVYLKFDSDIARAE